MALPTFPLSGFWPGVDSAEIHGSSELYPKEGSAWAGAEVGSTEDSTEVTYLAHCVQVGCE